MFASSSLVASVVACVTVCRQLLKNFFSICPYVDAVVEITPVLLVVLCRLLWLTCVRGH